MKDSGRVRTLLVAVLTPIALLVALATWAFASPIGASPDDNYHMTTIWCSGGPEDLCQEGEAAYERHIPAVLLSSPACYMFDPSASASCRQEPSHELVSSDRGDFVGSYPPVFYSAMGLFAGDNIAVSVLLMRLFNAFLYVAFVSAVFFLLPRGRRAPLVWGSAITLVPLGMFLIPSVNPSSWAVLSATVLWIALVGYFQTDMRWRRIAFGGIALLSSVMGAGARSDAAVYAGVAVVVAVVLTFKRTRDYAKLAILPVVVVVIALAFFFSAGQSSVLDPANAPQEPTLRSVVMLTLVNLVDLPSLWVGSLGTWGLGWLDTAMPPSVWVSAVAVFFGLVYWGIQKIGARKAVSLGLVFASLVAVPLYVLVKDGVTVGAGVQPRYIYPLLIMFAGLALVGLGRDGMGQSKLQLAVGPILLTVANSIALHTNIRRYVTGTDVSGPNLNSNVEWWWTIPISPMATWIIGTLSFGVAMLGVYAYARANLNPRPAAQVSAV